MRMTKGIDGANGVDFIVSQQQTKDEHGHSCILGAISIRLGRWWPNESGKWKQAWHGKAKCKVGNVKSTIDKCTSESCKLQQIGLYLSFTLCFCVRVHACTPLDVIR